MKMKGDSSQREFLWEGLGQIKATGIIIDPVHGSERKESRSFYAIETELPQIPLSSLVVTILLVYKGLSRRDLWCCLYLMGSSDNAAMSRCRVMVQSESSHDNGV